MPRVEQEDFAAFARLVTALQPWLNDLVLVGGWAHRLHRFHPLAQNPGYLPLRTRDADLAFSPEAALRGSIRTALRNAGFEEELLGDDRPPAAHYRLGEEDAGFYAEFLTPLVGSGITRSGQNDATVSKAGITAQKLRYVELLLIKPWRVTVGPKQGFPLPAGLSVHLPNPASFIVQKLLIHGDRKPAKKAQDILYIHDTLELFGTTLPELRAIWLDELQPSLPAGRHAESSR